MHKEFLLGLLLFPSYLFAQQFEPLSTFVQFNSNPIEVVSYTPDEQIIIAGDSEGYIYFWSVDNGSLVKIVRAHKEKINSLSISPDGQNMATAGNDNKLIIWDLANRSILKSMEIPESANFIAFGMHNVIFYTDDHTVYKSTLGDSFSPVTIFESRKPITNAAIISEFNKIGLCSSKFVYLLNLENGSRENKIKCCKKMVEDIDLFKDQLLCYKCEDGSLSVMRLETEKPKVINMGNGGYSQILISNTGKYLAEGNIGNMARLWDVETGEKIADLKGHQGPVSALDFSNDDEYLLTGSHDGTVSLWSTQGKKKDEKAVTETKDTDELVYSEQQIPTFLKGRSVETQQTAKISSPKLDIFVWDNENVDGDIISLNFNGKWILKDYSVTKIRKKIALNLNPNSNNYLILYAHNLGKNPPNTAAISFVNDGSEKILTINSDLKKCGAVNFVFE